ncbi:MAG: MFS transporter [Candidatus Abyssobacteria bacterium SURF_5]|uniref:MFS transporter n=1 Tax=Abyssobacteria bacterium (strain SURF_5) TaxID=2093360 RepID=A0A3A4NUY5_ABYX5|nr:MAG: MFS transporter [Candidatus Abyssubacteria bacterium SURF_5]
MSRQLQRRTFFTIIGEEIGQFERRASKSVNGQERTLETAPSVQSIEASALSPLRHPVFRSLWLASVVSNVGTWMQAVGAAWLMTSLAPSPVMVALVQAANTLPMFLLALPAGALADIIDRRRLLLFAQCWMMLAAAVLGFLTVYSITDAWLLLLLTFSLGIGAALNAPAWQAIVLDVVPRSDLTAAVSLNSAGFNVARAVGPTLGGIVIAASGPGAVFLINAASFLAVVIVLFLWRKPATRSVLPAERVFGAIRTGIRYVRHAPALQAIFLRAVAFIGFGSSIRALLPVITRFELERGPTAYGVLLGFLGAGSVAGAFLMPAMRRRMNVDALLAFSALLFAGMLFTFAGVRVFWVLCAAMFAGGVAWLALLSTFNASVQAAVPVWVRGRALSVYLLIFFGGLAGGSALWGAVAEAISLSASLVIAGAGTILGLVATMQFSLSRRQTEGLEPAMDWPTPTLVGGGVETGRGAVLVTIEYRIDPARQREFVGAMQRLRRIRRRDGALRWGLGRDTTDPERFIEFYVVESWTEHLRQHERLTVADRAAFEHARSFHTADLPPSVSHFVFLSGKNEGA